MGYDLRVVRSTPRSLAPSRICGLLGVVIALSILLAAVAPAAEERDVFTVASVPVDATAADANTARDAARLGGERRAYAMLLDRLTLASDHDRLPHPDDTALDALIGGFEVANERRSSVRYLANYTFHFRADAVRQSLRQAGIAFAETPSRPLVVLAVLQTESGPVLWDDPNLWRDAWAHSRLPSGLVPFVLPFGELEDVAAIDADTAAKGDGARLAAVSQRYGGDDVLVTRATLKTDADPHSLEISSTRYAPTAGTNDVSWAGSYKAAAGESDADLLARAVAGTTEQVESAWKAANILNFKQTGTLVVRVPIADLPGWVAVRDALAGVPAIERSDLLSLDRREARLAIHYVGDTNQLRLALAQRDLELGGAAPDWVLARRKSTAHP